MTLLTLFSILKLHFAGDGSLGLGKHDDRLYPEVNHKWISELAEEKANSLPNLIRVKLMEDLCNECTDFAKWQDPYNIEPTLDAAGIRLTVWLRYRRRTYWEIRRDSIDGP